MSSRHVCCHCLKTCSELESRCASAGTKRNKLSLVSGVPMRTCPKQHPEVATPSRAKPLHQPLMHEALIHEISRKEHHSTADVIAEDGIVVG